ncbi:MAG: thermonuclease family protein [Methanophagales archaeon]|nr:thermonuclease family protein [Methanophagales archaeon]
MIDGDTVVLRDGERVRLIGIDAPEKGQPDSEAATRRLKDLIEGRYVTLEKDVEDKDRFGRLLRYIYVNDTFVNLEVVREGYASVFIIYPNIRYSSEFEDAMQKEI